MIIPGRLKRLIFSSIWLTLSMITDAGAAGQQVSIRQINHDTRLIILGDTDHLNQAIRAKAASLIRSLKTKDPEFNCLFLEWGKESNGVFQDYLQERKNYQDLILVDRERISHETRNGTYNLVPKPLLDAARESGYQVFGINPEASSQITRASSIAKFAFQSFGHDDEEEAYLKAPPDIIKKMIQDTVEARSEFSANEISDLFKNHACKKGILIFGSAHLKQDDHGYPVKPIQGDLELKGIISQVFDLQ